MIDHNHLSFPPTPTLNILPQELQDMIISHIDLVHAQALRQTNKHFHDLFPPYVPTTKAELMKGEGTGLVRQRQLLWCNPCNKLRHVDKFSDKMRKTSKRRNKGGKYTRFCVECGCRPNDVENNFRYSAGSYWTVNSVRYVLCTRCKKGAIAPHSTSVNAENKMCLVCTEDDEQEKVIKQKEVEAHFREEKRKERERRGKGDKKDRDLQYE